jgi:uncharacterized damage-inducible protein DinB
LAIAPNSAARAVEPADWFEPVPRWVGGGCHKGGVTVGTEGVEMDSEVEMFRTWFAYLADTRRGYIETLAKLPTAELTRDRGASYPTLLDIFAHSQGALYFWMKDCATFAFPPQDGDSDAPPSIEVVRKDEKYVQTQVQRVMSDLSPANLSRTILRKKSAWETHDCHIPVREALWHLVEEELQHRGELNALLWEIDVDPPVVSWITWDHTAGRIKDPSS